MSHKIFLTAVFALLALGLSVMMADAQGPKPKAPKALAGSGFTYQGQLKSNGALVNSTCDFQFGLWDAGTIGAQVGTTQTVSALSVTNGLFTVQLNDTGQITSGTAFNGDARWLAEAVRCPSAGGSYTALNPRQMLAPAPMAFALPGLYTRQNATSPNVIGGYSGNVITPTFYGATIGGGGQSGSPNRAGNDYATIGGGIGNNANGLEATVGGGSTNSATGLGATIGGGAINSASGADTTIGGGGANTASGDNAIVGGGSGNTASGMYSTVGGGGDNKAGGFGATIGGGLSNSATMDYAFAAGHKAQALHQGAFVWGDSTNATISSSDYNQFIVRANGGIWFGAATVNITPSIGAGNFISTSTGAKLTTAGVWTDVSDRNAKTNFQAVDDRVLLTRLSALPVMTWNYKAEDASIRHIGPMAQDFYAAFGVGNDDTHLAALDTNGVALAAIQGMYKVVEEKDAEITGLKSQVASQQKQIDGLETRIAALERGAPVRADADPISTSWVLFGGLIMAGLVIARRRG